ncbi:MAG: TetR/AcrR family transcriptional regulator [Ilumatobacteraceae bacterium]
MPTSGVDRLHPTAAMLLERAVDVIDVSGEQAVRVEEISARCKVSITSLYHHFGNREGLIEAAQAERFARTSRRTIEQFATDVDTVTSAEELRPLIARWVIGVVGVTAADVREVRAQVLASALTRPRLKEKVIELNREQFDRLAGVLSRAQERGLLKGTLDTRASAIAFTCLAFGRVVAELDPVDGPGTEDFYAAFAVAAIDQLLFGEA